MVFFDYDSAVLDDVALETIRKAAQASQDAGRSTICVTGHADTSGQILYNFGLSRRRALAVRDALVDLGYP